MKTPPSNKEAKQLGMRILLADDHPLLREGFAHALEEYGDVTAVESTATPESAVELFGEFKPDVVVMDILFAEETTGLNAIKAILLDDPEAKIVAFSQHEQASMVREVYKLGALAFVPKDADADELHEAICSAFIGEKHFPPGVAERLVVLSASDEAPQDVLSEREFAVYRLTALGKNTREIAELLEINEKAVNNARYTLKRKLQLTSAAEIIKHALRHGVISLR